MGVPAAAQCRIFSPTSSGGRVSNWSLPVWMILGCSYSVSMALELKGPFVAVHARVTREMNIKDGTIVEFEILEAGERFSHKVVVKDNISDDVIVHGAGLLGIAKGESIFTSIDSSTANSYALILKS